MLALGALGIVYGDIGTSPLYALRECFYGPHGMTPTRDNVIGVLSLVFWVLIVVISIKYLLYVMRADNRGEGGILELMALGSSDSGVRAGRAHGCALGIWRRAALRRRLISGDHTLRRSRARKVATRFQTSWETTIGI